MGNSQILNFLFLVVEFLKILGWYNQDFGFVYFPHSIASPLFIALHKSNQA
ncbi:hypothetical protein [Rodentibacter ratti]|uniref:hypothetical protein n=1 Tax=Rodentibacter ratti TaxID=1906745 RepID=UPI0015D6634D|nr:hypothetical protein [Rodentibacter ratti]